MHGDQIIEKEFTMESKHVEMKIDNCKSDNNPPSKLKINVKGIILSHEDSKIFEELQEIVRSRSPQKLREITKEKKVVKFTPSINIIAAEETYTPEPI